MKIEPKLLEELVKRLAASTRAATLYGPTHPLVQRNVEELGTACSRLLQLNDQLVIGFLGDEVVVNGMRLARSGAGLAGLARFLRSQDTEKITIRPGVSRDELRAFINELTDKSAAAPLQQRFARSGVRNIAIGLIASDNTAAILGVAAARKVYVSAASTAEELWAETRSGEQPNPQTAYSLIDSLSRIVQADQSSLLALTALKRYDNYTFTHMVNVSILTMAQARSLGISAVLVREFGVAALMHDIGKVHTPAEILNKPDALTPEEFTIVKRHVIDGAHILRATPEMPALAPIVAFEHHLRLDMSGYPEKITPRTLNLCTMLVSIADVYDALRANRTYREGLPHDRVRAIMAQQAGAGFNPTLLRRFITLVGLYPVGTLVRLNTEEIGVVTAEHPGDPFRPQVKVIIDRHGQTIERPFLVNTWDRDERSHSSRAVVEAVDADAYKLDPLAFLGGVAA
jgi:putative nucleotidyltransferase with HDIG domain